MGSLPQKLGKSRKRNRGNDPLVRRSSVLICQQGALELQMQRKHAICSQLPTHQQHLIIKISHILTMTFIVLGLFMECIAVSVYKRRFCVCGEL